MSDDLIQQYAAKDPVNAAAAKEQLHGGLQAHFSSGELDSANGLLSDLGNIILTTVYTIADQCQKSGVILPQKLDISLKIGNQFFVPVTIGVDVADGESWTEASITNIAAAVVGFIVEAATVTAIGTLTAAGGGLISTVVSGAAAVIGSVAVGYFTAEYTADLIGTVWDHWVEPGIEGHWNSNDNSADFTTSARLSDVLREDWDSASVEDAEGEKVNLKLDDLNSWTLTSADSENGLVIKYNKGTDTFEFKNPGDGITSFWDMYYSYGDNLTATQWALNQLEGYGSTEGSAIVEEILRHHEGDFNVVVGGSTSHRVHNYYHLELQEIQELASNGNKAALWALKSLSSFVEEGKYPEGAVDPEEYSDNYITDRAAFLYYYLNNSKLGGDLLSDTGDDIDFKDLGTFQEAYAGNGEIDLPGNAQYIFGSDESDSNIVGGSKADHLYGMGGNDTLDGGSGANYLEGGADHDTYILQMDGKADTLFDVDGDGEIRVGSELVSGTFTRSFDGGVYLSGDSKWGLRERGDGDWDLLGRNSDNEYEDIAVLKDWEDGALGLSLSQSDPDYIVVDKSTMYSYFFVFSMNNAPRGTHLVGSGKNDLFFGSDFSDKIETGIGNTNLVYSRRGDDIVIGGDGRDYIRSGFSFSPETGESDNDHVEGGGASDIILGGSGADQLYGGYKIDAIEESNAESDTLGDWIGGEAGSDVCVGSNRRDFLFGGGGGDELQGGAGDDLLLGDASYQVKRQFEMMDGIFVRGYEWNSVQGAVVEQSNPSLLYPLGAMFSNWGWSSTAGGDFAFAPAMQFIQEARIDENPGNDYINAGAGNDFAAGQSGDDVVYGGDGDDTLYGDDAVALSDGEEGDDMLLAGNGVDRLYGGGGDDQLYANDDDGELDLLRGGEGGDLLWGGSGGDQLYGEAGDDELHAGVGSGDIRGGTGNDLLYGSSDADALFGGMDNDLYYSSAGNDTLTDAGGNDRYHLRRIDFTDAGSLTTIQDTDGNGSLWLDGVQIDGTGVQKTGDASWEAISGGYSLVLSGGDLTLTIDGQAGRAVIKNFGSQDSNTLGIVLPGNEGPPENHAPVVGVPPEDTTIVTGALFGYTIAPTTFTDPDNDPLSYSASLADGSPLPDWLDFDAASGSFSGTPSELGSFTILLTATDDGGLSAETSFTLSVVAFNEINGSAENDTLQGTVYDDLILGLDGNDYIAAKNGNDTLKGGAGNDTLIGNQDNDTLFGEAGNDSLRGSLGDDWLDGGDGADYLSGGMGDDSLYGGLGNDTLSAGQGDDSLWGENGDDSLFGRKGADQLSGGAGNDTLIGNQDDDTLMGDAGNDSLRGSTGNDLLYGGEDGDSLSGGVGKDTLYGDAGNDVLSAGKGDDQLFGGAGSDTLNGRLGNDSLTGGEGSDTFVFSSALAGDNIDTISDFTSGMDKISLDTAIFTELGEPGALSADLFAANSEGNALDGNDHILYNTTTGALYYDPDGNGAKAAVQFAVLEDTSELKSTDFLVTAA